LASSPASIVTTPTPTPAAIPARPLFFAIADRPVYAVFHPPHGARTRSAVVVHCHTVGVEQLTSYRVEVLGARAAAAAGYPVFRYHARGHGDSAGDLADVTFESLVQDARAAADHARRLSEASRVIWLGVRFGALVAAEAARGRADTAALALWEPVHDPQEYFRAMLRNLLFSLVVKGERPSVTVDQLFATIIEREGRVSVHGYYLHRPLIQSSRGRRLAQALASWAGPTFLAQVQPRGTLAPAHGALAAGLAKRGASVTVAQINDEPGWHFLANPAWEGAGLVERYAEWIDALA
jgi:alpha/beta superfamily hydrolase